MGYLKNLTFELLILSITGRLLPNTIDFYVIDTDSTMPQLSMITGFRTAILEFTFSLFALSVNRISQPIS